MLNFNPSRWLTTLKRSQPIWKSREEAHELLRDNGASGHAVLKWSQTQNYSIFGLSLRNIHVKTLCCTLLLAFVAGFVLLRPHKATPVVTEPENPGNPGWPWDNFRVIDGYYQGISKLVKIDQFIPDTTNSASGGDGTISTSRLSRTTSANLLHSTSERSTSIGLLAYQPKLRSTPSTDTFTLPSVQQCFLNINNDIAAPLIYAWDGVPQHSVEPTIGSYDLLGLRKDVCFDRYGRYGAYGLGYGSFTGGSDLGIHGDQSSTEPVWKISGQIDWRSIDLSDAQKRCYEQNKGRFAQPRQNNTHERVGSLAEFVDEEYQPGNRNKIPRTAFILRAWGGLEYTPAVRLYLRSLVNELSLHSGGEYDVHLLVEVKDESKPIWTSTAAYDEVLAELVPEEFRGMATLWSQELMKLIYPGPFQPQFHDHGSMYPAMRSMHFALQWFMVQHPEYEYFWNWETDIRYIGHWYELFNSVSTWAKNQPRDYLWARAARYYIPNLYDDWDTFVRDTAQKAQEKIDSEESRLDEEADFISFNPIFNPDQTHWNRREDVTGYDTAQPIPERRASIVISARFSRRLLLVMHSENYKMRHSMGSEMFAASMCLHHGLKAVFAPHPIYFEREWPAEYAEEIFNGGPGSQTGLFEECVFGEGPKGMFMALKGTTFFYEIPFPQVLWRRWMGYREEGRGGEAEELRQGAEGMGGRMCLRSMLLHPIKQDVGLID